MNYRKLSAILILLLFCACDKIPDGIVEHQVADFKIISVNAPSSFSYSPADSFVVVNIVIENIETVANVWVTVKSLDSRITIIDRQDLFDDGNAGLTGDQIKGDGIYSGKFQVSQKTPAGQYNIDFFVQDRIKPSLTNVVKVGSHIFFYENKNTNEPPVVSELSIQNSVVRGVPFVFSIKAEDPNGMLDILHVFFKLFRPDGTLVEPKNGYDYFIMVDNGDLVLGDQSANDGIYSFKNSFGTDSQIGIWRFEFQAKDRSGSLSNQIIHKMNVN